MLSSALLLSATFGAANANADQQTFYTIGCGGSGGVSANEFTVPAGVSSIDITAVGAKGGNAGGASGGAGAALGADAVSVTPGETLYFCVGTGKGAGGSASQAGNSGGGLAAVSRNQNPMVSPLMVAAGGGGAAGGGIAGGIASGLDGVAGAGASGFDGPGGFGATSTGPGAYGSNGSQPSAEGTLGAAAAGGAGGVGQFGGGGGGAGVYGGGGGAGGIVGSAGGGGGGSSLCTLPSCSHTANAVPVSSVVVSYGGPTTTTVSTPQIVARRSQVTVSATVTPSATGGTVAYKLNGAPIPGCAAVAVNSACVFEAPSQLAQHTVTAEFSGFAGTPQMGDGAQASAGTGHFTVGEATLSVAEGDGAFGTTPVGQAATRTLTIKNAGSVAVKGTGVEVGAGPFSLESETCKDAKLVADKTCTVTVAFKPVAAGAARATLAVTTTDGTVALDLTGTGAAGPVAPPQPPLVPSIASEPAALAPQAGGKLTAKAGKLALPIACPSATACTVSGTLSLSRGEVKGGGEAKATSRRYLAKFAALAIKAEGTKTVKVKVTDRFLRSMRRHGTTKVKATLRLVTTLASGERLVKRQEITLKFSAR